MANAEPLPWWTYPSIEFISHILNKTHVVFEYGCGNSTLWASQYVQRIISVDHNSQWIDKISSRLASPHTVIKKGRAQIQKPAYSNIHEIYFSQNPRESFDYDEEKITRRGLNDREFIEYVEEISRHQILFDCIIIDGMARRLCAYYAPEYLKKDGFIIFDNSNRSDYMEGYKYLLSLGFYHVPFWGLVPGAEFPSCTSIFAKSHNIFKGVSMHSSIFDIPEY
ncbi:hypothetical protein [Leptothoe kymatousa]|uniref:Methyltransferase domain-containing protein n=1 Tax=Leptothoe kymatousa TAU-MAC 1615 TaxID=2364775 RepID=A0ABS5Y5C8_9CYAN|nr:hypothetical protein [Leptothoe kymatousa]MBT9313007.1 hypothetical protein [Leptothoe kymatousa TAU-MAC 1615]